MYREFAGLKAKTNGNCPICKSLAYNDSNSPGGDTLVVCPTCGKYRFSFDVLNFFAGLDSSHDNRRYKLSNAMRVVSERAVGRRDNSFLPLYSSDDLNRILQDSDLPVQDKLRALLSHLGKLSEFPGQIVEFDSDHDYPVLDAKNPEESEFYMQSLAEQRLVILEEKTFDTIGIPIKVSAEGWLELDRITQSGGESSNGFIAMWFDPSRTAFEAAMNEAITDAGYVPVRVDRVEHLNRIDDEIIAQIRLAKFLIADLTRQRNGVYFEAGFMLGLGRPVIWVCDKSDLGNVHFDTRQYNTIDYSDTEELRSRLQFRIEANLGKGPHAGAPGSRPSFGR